MPFSAFIITNHLNIGKKQLEQDLFLDITVKEQPLNLIIQLESQQIC